MPAGLELQDMDDTHGFSKLATEHLEPSDDSSRGCSSMDIMGRRYGPPLPVRYNDIEVHFSLLRCSTVITWLAWWALVFRGCFPCQSWKMRQLAPARSCPIPWDCFYRRLTSSEITLPMSSLAGISGLAR